MAQKTLISFHEINSRIIAANLSLCCSNGTFICVFLPNFLFSKTRICKNSTKIKFYRLWKIVMHLSGSHSFSALKDVILILTMNIKQEVEFLMSIKY